MMSGDAGRRALRIQPNSNIKARLKPRIRTTKQKEPEKAEPTSIEQLKECLLELKNYDGSIENVSILGDLLELTQNAGKELLENDQLYENVFDKTPQLLCSDDPRIRTAVFRLLRLLLVNERRLITYLSLLVDVFAVRSLDILILTKTERFEALRLLSCMLNFWVNTVEKPKLLEHIEFPVSALKSIHAVAVHRLIYAELGEPEPKVDELNKAALGIIIEMSIRDPLMVIEHCSTDWIPRVLVSPGLNNFQIGALVCRVLSAWMEDPVIRERAGLQLLMEQIFAPLLDLGFFHQTDPKLKNTHKVTQTLENCANIFMNLMCTWSGFYACASTEPLIGSIASPLKLLSYLGQVKSVGSNLDKIREMVIDVCCDFVCMPYAGKTFNSWPDTLLFYSKLHQPDLYESSLRDEFVVGEMNSVLANGIGDTDYVDLLLSFRALATFVLVNFGLVQSLIRLILAVPNEPMGLKATLLLGDLLRTSVSFVPKDWKQLLLSTPALIQLMAQSLLNNVAGEIEKRGSFDRDQVLPSSENSILLLHRLEEVYTISQTRPSFVSQLKNANLFVLPSKAGHDRPKGGKFYEDDSEADGQCSDAISRFLDDDKQKWMHFDFLIQRFRNLPSLFHRWQHNDKCHTFFVQVTEFFAPKNQTFLKEPLTHEVFKSGSIAFRLIVRLAELEPYYNEILEKYIVDFCRELPENVLYNGVFSPRNIMHTNVYLYFSIVATIGSKSYGHKLLERAGFYQICLDLVTSTTPIEYIKLILSSLNYNKSGITRVILETALTATNEHARKWITKFLEVLLVLQVLPDFEDYGMRLLFQQLSDPSGKVVRSAVRILSKWLPKFPKSLKHMKNVRIETLGDAGILLDVHLHSNEECVCLDLDRSRSTLHYWMQAFNKRYVHIVEEEMRLALANFKRSMSGRFARSSTQRKPLQSVRAPAHLFGALAKHSTGLQLLEKEGTLHVLIAKIQEPLTNDKCVEMKATLLALGHIIGSLNEHTGHRIMPPDIVELICEFAEQCPYLSVRGIAFFALNLCAQSKYGVGELIKLGWESNRHIDLQEKLSAQLRAQQINDLNIRSVEEKMAKLSVQTDPIEDFRSCRSNSLYTRAGNEALTALRHRAIQSRRRNTSSCLSQRLSESNEEDTIEMSELALEELEFDVEMHSVLSNPTIKPSEILMHKAMKKDDKNRASTLAKDSNSRLLQRDFLTYVKGIAVFDKFWLLSDSETNELMEYRNLWVEMPENLKKTRVKSIEREKSALEKSLVQNSVGNNWTVCTIPREMQLISENIFHTIHSMTATDEIKLSTQVPEAKKPAPTPTITNQQHEQRKCFYCLAINGKLDARVKTLFNAFELSDQQRTDYTQRRDDILLSMTMLEVREQTYQTRLANHHRACTAFQHPCIYADALELLNELSYSLETRSYIQQLFWQTFTQLVND